MSTRKESLLKQFSIIGSGTIITLFLGLLNAPIITRIVNPVDYGKYSLFITYGNLAASILFLGMDQALVRYYYGDKKLNYKNELLKKTLRIPVIFTTIVSIIAYLFLINGFFGNSINRIILTLLIVYVYIILFRRFSDLIVRLEFHSKLYSFNNIVNKISYLIVAIVLLLFSQLNHSYSLIISVITAAFISIVIGIYSERKLWFVQKNNDYESQISSNKILKYSYPYIFSMGITSLFNSNDKLFLNYFGSADQLGIFSSATSMVALLSIFQATFNTVWAPTALEHYSKYPMDKNFHIKANEIITIIMFAVGLTVILFKDVFSYFLGPSFREASYILPGLIFGPIMYTISETTVSGIVFKEKSEMHIIIALGSLISGVIINLLLVPKYGGVGASLGTGFSYIVFFTLRTLISNLYYYIDFSLRKFYLITGVSYLFAIYNSFVPFNYITVLSYLGCMIILILLYFHRIKYMTFITSNKIIEMLNKS